ncbi:MAG TPA: hypothetical protein VM925_15075 [Labilithrix sp.]|jgi:hypothetical protein|nr:hypothetical protein [Labilithrix sp.]
MSRDASREDEVGNAGTYAPDVAHDADDADDADDSELAARCVRSGYMQSIHVATPMMTRSIPA